MSYLGNSPQSVTSVDYRFVATASQTVFSGNDVDGKILSFEIGNVDVFVNGSLLTSDQYTETTGTITPVSYTHLRAHETSLHLVCRLLLEKNPVRSGASRCGA